MKKKDSGKSMLSRHFGALLSGGETVGKALMCVVTPRPRPGGGHFYLILLEQMVWGYCVRLLSLQALHATLTGATSMVLQIQGHRSCQEHRIGHASDIPGKSQKNP